LIRTIIVSYRVYPKLILKLFKKYDNQCEYCNFRTLLKGELNYHTKEVHGKNISLSFDNLKKNNDATEYKYGEAIKCYNKAIEINSQDVGAWTKKGVALYNLKKYNEAIECYDKAIEINPNYALAWYTKGNSLNELERYDEAIKCYDKAIELDPHHSYAWNNKSNAFVSRKI
jgi:tetratricopeptide (TPR) repeat protein